MAENKEEMDNISVVMKMQFIHFIDECVTEYKRQRKEITLKIQELLLVTLIGVFIGVLTNISAEYFLVGQLTLGLIILILSIVVSIVSFFLWRIFQQKNLEKEINTIINKVNRDANILSPETTINSIIKDINRENKPDKSS